jgi:hypothetical protein
LLITCLQVSAHKQTSTGSVLMQHGYLYCAKRTLQLHSLMGQLKDTMSREQRLVMELLLRFVYQVGGRHLPCSLPAVLSHRLVLQKEGALQLSLGRAAECSLSTEA